MSEPFLFIGWKSVGGGLLAATIRREYRAINSFSADSASNMSSVHAVDSGEFDGPLYPFLTRHLIALIDAIGPAQSGNSPLHPRRQIPRFNRLSLTILLICVALPVGGLPHRVRGDASVGWSEVVPKQV